MDDTLQRELVDRASWLPWFLLGLGVLSASASAILIRYAEGAGPLAISFWRCFGGAMVLAPFAHRGLPGLKRSGWRMPLLAGGFLALHFATWITSLELTTVAASVLLVCTTPIFVAIAARFLLHERLTRIAWFGILLACVGAAVIGGSDLSGSNLLGDALALIGGAAVGGYVLAGQVARRYLGIIEYALITYSVAAGLLLVVCLIAGTPLWGYDAQTWWAIVGIIIGPQLLGHTVINYVLKDIDATTVSVMTMAETLIATVLAYFFFAEVPSFWIYPGGIAILVGMYLVTDARRARPEIIG